MAKSINMTNEMPRRSPGARLRHAAEAFCVTLGPKGRNVVLEKKVWCPPNH